MGFHRIWFRRRSLRNDEGYKFRLVGRRASTRIYEYSDGQHSIQVASEPARVRRGDKLAWTEHFALNDRYLLHWSDGVETSAEERDVVRDRIHASLKYLRITHTLDVPNHRAPQKSCEA
jgi:hypothetical protein